LLPLSATKLEVWVRNNHIQLSAAGERIDIDESPYTWLGNLHPGNGKTIVGTSSRNGRLNTLGHFEKKAYKVLLWLQPYQSACMPCNGIHCYQTGSQNYLIGWAGQLMKLLPLINLLLPA